MTAGQAAAFDAVASAYDRSFTHTRLGRWLRAAVWERLAIHFQPGMRVLELGCGTGEDALWLARRGVRVTATDASSAMLQVAAEKARAAGLAEVIDFRLLALPGGDPGGAGFDGALSNFGVLNCVADLRGVAAWLAGALRPRSRAVLVVMGPWCPWEVVWFLAHGDVRTAFRRLRRDGVRSAVAGQPLHVWYHPPGRLRDAFVPWFHVLGLRGVGVFLPPSAVGSLVERRAAWFEPLRAVEARLAGAWPFRLLGDHYLVELERREA